ncbi:hypothetical protein OJAV_G00105330 [Oryzias javanicus]|uniref:Uncharacterized protein n=1 Tax=Oryzias javanicus TaxID=123683 RepID=A0A437CY92_ORYJA|nr:hypothetical protein OJAV_G00105330 [Oryzias javanicus]
MSFVTDLTPSFMNPCSRRCIGVCRGTLAVLRTHESALLLQKGFKLYLHQINADGSLSSSSRSPSADSMWVQAAALLLACCVWPAQSQRDGGRAHNIWENPISFNTKGKDKCTMIITGQGENTRLRISCRSSERFYWSTATGPSEGSSTTSKAARRTVQTHACKAVPEESHPSEAKSEAHTDDQHESNTAAGGERRKENVSTVLLEVAAGHLLLRHRRLSELSREVTGSRAHFCSCFFQTQT